MLWPEVAGEGRRADLGAESDGAVPNPWEPRVDSILPLAVGRRDTDRLPMAVRPAEPPGPGGAPAPAGSGSAATAPRRVAPGEGRSAGFGSPAADSPAARSAPMVCDGHH